MMQEVLASFGLAGEIISAELVGRAWSNRVFHVRSTSGEYAIKQLLNPWQDPDWLAWLGEAAAFELRAAEAGVAMPRPILSPEGLIFVEVGPDAFRVHEWASGQPCPDGPVDEQTARRVGADLARMHGLRHLPGRTDFTGQPMSHGDVDQKNLIMTSDGPVLCDWDVAAPWPPRQELARTALSLAGWKKPDIARAVIAGYREGGGKAYDIVPEDLGVDISVGLDWLVLCLERAAGLRDDGQQRRREAVESVPDLLSDLDGRLDLIENVSDWLTR